MVFSIKQTPSPNFNDRPIDAPIDTVIIHYTGMKTGGDALARLCDETAEVSAHYLIEEDGVCHQLVHPDKRAWHAGVSSWQGRENLNHTSIGIELVNPGHEFGYRAFPASQIDALMELLASLQSYKIPVERFLGHSDIAPIRKQDPGELFPWRQLADAGFGSVPQAEGLNTSVLLSLSDSGESVSEMKEKLQTIGYAPPIGDRFCEETRFTVEALQRHWRQSSVSGVFDAGTQEIVIELANNFGAHDIIAP